MTKDKNPQEEPKTNSEKVLAQVEERNDWLLDTYDNAVDLSELKKQYDIEYPHVKANEIVGQTFIIVGAKTFPSSFEGQDYDPYFVTCFDEANEEYFTTVLGGEQPSKLLSTLIALDVNVPPRVTLNFHEGSGKFGGYYTLD